MTRQEHTYLVLARGSILVPDYGRMKATSRLSFVGRMAHRAPTVDALPTSARGAPVRELDATEWTGDAPSVEAWVASRSPVVVVAATHPDPERREEGNYYRERILEGGLWAADAATAKACGVVFDPAFGGEYPELVPATAAPTKAKE